MPAKQPGAELFVHAQGFDCFWDLLRSIPPSAEEGRLRSRTTSSCPRRSFPDPDAGCSCETESRSSCQSAGLTARRRRLLNRLMMEEEKQLRGKSVEDWFADDDSFVETDFWRLCASLYRIKESSSVSVLRALLCARSEQMMHLDTMEDWMQLPADPRHGADRSRSSRI